MTAALEAVDAERVDADSFAFERMTHRCALVDHFDSRFFERGQPFLWIIAGGLDDLHAAIDDRFDKSGIVGRRDGRKKSKVHAERLVGETAAFLDFCR